MRKFLTIAAAVLCLGVLTPDAQAGGTPFGFNSFNAMQASFSFDGSETAVIATIDTTIFGSGPLVFSATGPFGTVVGSAALAGNPDCTNGSDYACHFMTVPMLFDGNADGTPITLVGRVCVGTTLGCTTASSTFVARAPEPDVLALLALSQLGLGFARRRATN